MRADSSFSKKKISLFLGAGPSNVTLSPPQSITGGRSAAEKPIDEENFITSHTSFRVKSEISGKDATSPTSDAGIMLACGSNHEYETGKG